MGRFLLHRLAHSILVLLAIITLSFFLQRIAPGGPFDDDRSLAPEIREQIEREWHLDRPLSEQYLSYLNGLLSWPPDLKRSMKQPDYTVVEILRPRLLVSLSLATFVLLLALGLGIPLGILAAECRGRLGDRLVMMLAVVFATIPAFVLGPLLKWVFALRLGWLPESRWVSPASMILPGLALSAVSMATVARLVRSGLVEILNEDYIRTARSKGVTDVQILMRHALPGALLPVLTWLGPALASLATGSVVIERVFSIPGAGSVFVDAAFNRDYTLVMGTVIVYSVFLIVLNLLVDLLLPFFDPRLRGHMS